MTWQNAVAFLSVAIAVSASGHAGEAGPAARTVGVVEFYAPTPLGAYGIVPERFAASSLSMLLMQAAADRFTVVPRDSMERTETSLGWQSGDVLNYDRLGALAKAVGASALVVGRIPLLVNLDGGRVPPGASANTNLLLQVFDPARGRVVAETRQSAFVVAGIPRDLLAERVLHEALLHAVPSLIDTLSAVAP